MVEEKTYSAKQVATRIGTDAKTLRKFFRSSASPFEAVGQGGRYEFPAKELPEIKKLFDRWNKSKNDISGKGPKVKPEPNGKVHTKVQADHRPIPYIASGPDTRPVNKAKAKKIAERELAEQELLELEEELEDPTEEDLEFDEDLDLEDLELDDE